MSVWKEMVLINVGIIAVGIIVVALCDTYLGPDDPVEEVVNTVVKAETGVDAEVIVEAIERHRNGAHESKL